MWSLWLKVQSYNCQFHLQFRSTVEFHSVPKLSHNSTHLSLFPAPQTGSKSCVISSFCQNFPINRQRALIVQCLLGIFQSGLTARFHLLQVGDLPLDVSFLPPTGLIQGEAGHVAHLLGTLNGWKSRTCEGSPGFQCFRRQGR